MNLYTHYYKCRNIILISISALSVLLAKLLNWVSRILCRVGNRPFCQMVNCRSSVGKVLGGRGFELGGQLPIRLYLLNCRRGPALDSTWCLPYTPGDSSQKLRCTLRVRRDEWAFRGIHVRVAIIRIITSRRLGGSGALIPRARPRSSTVALALQSIPIHSTRLSRIRRAKQSSAELRIINQLTTAKELLYPLYMHNFCSQMCECGVREGQRRSKPELEKMRIQQWRLSFWLALCIQPSSSTLLLLCCANFLGLNRIKAHYRVD